jgi:dienelactone hydrolase
VNASPVSALDVREPREPVDGGAAAVVLVLHGGREKSDRAVEPNQLAVRRMLPFAGDVARRVPTAAVALLRYRRRGWNGDGADALADVAHALDVLGERFGGAPVVLLGHSMGGRAAVHAAGAPNVLGVVALAPWLPDGEPVDQLSGRALALLHGTRDLTTSAAASARFAARAASVAADVACVRVRRSGHGMVLRAGLWHRLASNYVAAIVAADPLALPTALAVDAGCTSCLPGGR